jgi:hypothetical protein
VKIFKNQILFQALPSPVKFLHLTDIHFDPEYQEGTSIDCGEPLCCRPESRYQPEHRRTQALADMDKAGFWGEYRGCDMPWRTIESTINHIAEAHKVPLDKFLLFTFTSTLGLKHMEYLKRIATN